MIKKSEAYQNYDPLNQKGSKELEDFLKSNGDIYSAGPAHFYGLFVLTESSILKKDAKGYSKDPLYDDLLGMVFCFVGKLGVQFQSSIMESTIIVK